MSWDQTAEELLTALLSMVPDTYRSLAEGAARAEAEGIAADRGARSIEPHDVVRAWIATTPEDQRNGLVAVLEALGIDPEAYADDLSAPPEEETLDE